MKNNRKSDKITVANIVSIVGIIIMLLTSFMGHSYKSGGEMGWDILISVSLTSFTALLLWFMIKAKGAENRLDMWKKIEFATLAVYIVFAIPASLYGGIMHFFVVNDSDNKEDIRQAALADIKLIEGLINDYKQFETNAITITETGLKGVAGFNQSPATKLAEFMSHYSILRNNSSIENFINNQKDKLIGDTFDSYENQCEERSDEIKNIVDSWNLFKISSVSEKIETLAKNVESDLSKRSEEAKLPKIEVNISGKYDITEDNQEKVFKVFPDLPQGAYNFQFEKRLTEASGMGVIHFLIVILIHILILFNYIFAYRTSTLEIRKNINDGGGTTL